MLAHTIGQMELLLKEVLLIQMLEGGMQLYCNKDGRAEIHDRWFNPIKMLEEPD